MPGQASCKIILFSLNFCRISFKLTLRLINTFFLCDKTKILQTGSH